MMSASTASKQPGGTMIGVAGKQVRNGKMKLDMYGWEKNKTVHNYSIYSAARALRRNKHNVYATTKDDESAKNKITKYKEIVDKQYNKTNMYMEE
eukprot:9378859-Ditylum_brightwellii.AAC.1